MPPYRSRTTTHGRNMAGARGLWRATGMKDEDFGKPIIAIANSFTQFVPGVILSQLEMQTRASAQCALTMYSTLSAISSRLGKEYSIPP